MLLGRFFVRHTIFEIFEVKGQIYIFGHNSKTIGRIDLEQKRLDSSRRAAQTWCSHFFPSDAPFSRYLRFCVFWTGFRMWVMSCKVHVHSITFEPNVLESPNLVIRCIHGICNLGLIFEGQGQRSRSPEVKRSNISKTTGPIHSKQNQNVQLAKGFLPMCLVFEFHFRSKSSPEVKGQIDIFGHNSKTIGRIDLE